jgi:thiamine biosynthesis protein ThiI
MSLYLIRYGELGLKSPKVKKRFQNKLKKNIEDAFLQKKTQCLTSMDWGRIYIHTDNNVIAENILRRTFGITSFSRVIETSSDLDTVCKTAADYSKKIISKNSAFAVKARRTGSHKFTSQDVAVEVGSAILAANKKKNIKVNLSKPDIKIFVEVRHNRAFIFSEKILGPGGFPLGTQGKVLAVISDKKSVYSAWLMMKRGCRTKLVCLGEDALFYADKLKAWQLNLKPIFFKAEDGLKEVLGVAKKVRADALVLGYTLEEYENKPKIESDIPVFYPLIGLSEEEVDKKITLLFSDGS